MGPLIGTASFAFDFGAGKMSGHLDPTLTDQTGLGFNSFSLGRYDFVNTVYSPGSPSFSAQLSNSGVAGLGSLNGMFTGPSAEELMASFSAPFAWPELKTTGEVFGVLVGKRH